MKRINTPPHLLLFGHSPAELRPRQHQNNGTAAKSMRFIIVVVAQEN
jgi:hypothetical protein